MKVYAAEGAQRDSLCYGCTRRRLGCRKGCTRGAEEEIMKILLAGEREKKRRRISTHAPLARCDPIRIRYLVIPAHFNSRTSCEVRRQSSNSRSSTI